MEALASRIDLCTAKRCEGDFHYFERFFNFFCRLLQFDKIITDEFQELMCLLLTVSKNCLRQRNTIKAGFY